MGAWFAFLIAAAIGCSKATNLDEPKPSGNKHAGSNRDAGAAPVRDSGLASNSGGDAGGDSGGQVDGPVSYPDLDPTKFGTPAQVANGFTLAEGPLWDPCEKQLLFTDVSASVIHTLGTDGMVGVFMTDTNDTNGIAFDIDGSLILAEMGGQPGHIARRSRSGKVEVLDPPGSNLHTPDDVIVRSDGVIYFSDGNFLPVSTALNFGPLPVYELKPGSSKLIDGGAVGGPNGIELSPDEKTLYVDAYYDGTVLKFDVAEDGSLTQAGVFAAGLTNPDSLCLDAAGNLYVGISTGLAVFRPDGSPVALIPVPSAQGTTNCAFGGDDGKTLYITAWTSIWKLESMPIPGLDWMVNRERVKCGGK